MANSILTLCLLLSVNYMDFGFYVSGYQTVVGIYQHAPDGKCSNSYGSSQFFTPGSGTTCIDYNSALWEISGIEFHIGSCARLYANQTCHSKPDYVTYRNFGSCDLVPSRWNDHIRSMGYCPVQSKTFTCPAGSYVRKMYIPETDDLVSGITMHCFKPSSSSSDGPTASINSVGKSAQSSSNRECSFPMGARGVNLAWYYAYEYLYSYQGSDDYVCSGPGSSTSDMVCGQNQVLTGFTSVVEEGSEVTKGIKAICMDVLDPTLSCTPTEFESLVNIGTCDNTDGPSTKTCTISQKLGWGDPDQFSEAERNEKAFYSAYFSTASVPKILRNRFNSIGNSKIEGVTFNWAEHGTRSWSPLQTKTIPVTVPAETFTTFQQLQGKCGFYGVYTSYVKRIDVTTGSKPTQTVFMSGLM